MRSQLKNLLIRMIRLNLRRTTVSPPFQIRATIIIPPETAGCEILSPAATMAVVFMPVFVFVPLARPIPMINPLHVLGCRVRLIPSFQHSLDLGAPYFLAERTACMWKGLYKLDVLSHICHNIVFLGLWL